MKKLFDKLFRGPKLSRANAETFSKIIALKLYEEEITMRDFIANAEDIIESIFTNSFPNNSITPEQTKQLVRCGLFLLENEQGYLEGIVKDRKYFEQSGQFANRGSTRYRPTCFEHLTLFKDQ